MEECKKVLTWEQKIQNIESAPEEVRLMIAKAYLRDDIPDENVQYEFNTDSPEQLNEDGEIENLNADDPEGIGSTGFTMRTTRPANNKNFITRGSGGWNTCIKGNPRYQYADALANCVGYASGRFNEIINIARETTGCTYTTLNCNAVGFKERAEAAGLKTGSTPRRGAIMCWGKEGSAGHVAIVERVNNSNSVYTSESGWGSSAIFWNSTRSNNNGRWGIGAGYYFRCFIYLPDDVQKAIDAEDPTPTPQPTPSDKFNIGDKVVINGQLYGNADGDNPGKTVSNRITNITRIAEGHPYPYNTTGDLGWMAESSISPYIPTPTPNPTPTPTPTELKVGDTVKIVGGGRASSYGDKPVAGGIGWTRTILKIYKGRPYPNQVGNKTGTTGFYKDDALKKL